jgi:PLP dependent protein
MEALITKIRTNLEFVNQKIERAAIQSGRKAEDVRLVVVSKLQPIEVIHAAFDAGVRIFGENYPEEALSKIEAMKGKKDIEWHMIGHLQSRKAKIVCDSFTMLHSLDSFRLAEKLENRLAEKDKILPVLLEVNVSGEESKSGFPGWNNAAIDEFMEEVRQIILLPHLQINGLMTMPPLFEKPEMSRPYFARLRELRDRLQKEFSIIRWNELSMGTSADFESAIQEGASLVRIGQAILGPRPSTKNIMIGKI